LYSIGEELKVFLNNPTTKEGIRLIYWCKTNFANANVVFRALEACKHINTYVVVAFMRASRACGRLEEVLALWHALARLEVPQNVDIAINTLSACASMGSPKALEVKVTQ
jgi:hypothetical protein